MTHQLFPTYFISHGGGPWPWLKKEMPFYDELEKSLTDIPAQLPMKPKAILMISAHWEARDFGIMTSPTPPMVYDYGGFPEHTYHVRYPAPGSAELATRISELFTANQLRHHFDSKQGFDHGCFVPLVVMYPNADIPVVQVSIQRDYDPELHLALGRALAPLRAEGILIVGSGLSYHNLRLFGGAQAGLASREFDDWLDETLHHNQAPARVEKLKDWSKAPSARIAHPREDHLIPLMVALGAAENEEATRIYYENNFFGSITVSSYRFG